jgi:hypothetical protein
MEALQFFAISGTSDPVILRRIPEGFNPQLKNLKKHIHLIKTGLLMEKHV